MPYRLFLLGLSLLLLGSIGTHPALAQEENPSVKSTNPDFRLRINGNIQSRLSYGRSVPDDDTVEAVDRFGVGLRRARLRLNALIGPKASVRVQLDAANGNVQVVDFYAQYQLTDKIRLRMGRFVSAQPRGAALTSMVLIDIHDRVEVAEAWAARTIGTSARDFGIDLRYQFENGHATLYLHNGDDSWSRARGNFRPSNDNATDGVERTGFAVSAAGAYLPPSVEGVEVGGFVSYNNSRNPNTRFAGEERGRAYGSYGIHAYWGAEPGSQRFRLKFDAVGTMYEEADIPTLRDQDPQQYLGASLLGAARFHHSAEVFARYERLDLDTNADGDTDQYFFAGVTWSLSALRDKPFHHERLTFAYSLFQPDNTAVNTEHLLALQVLFVF